ncbi:hypothetical protein EDB19DRAFT_1714723 [Suillus lakei]|nr:hypothetical protein EDB19DRAFT_1714723 [Suillus lakei]
MRSLCSSVTFLPHGSYTLCRFIYISNICVGFLSMFSAECIFILRTLAVWHRERKFVVFKIINIVAYLVPIIVCFGEFISSARECSIPGGIGYVDTKAKYSVVVVYCLLVVGGLDILACVLYRAFESHGGWKIDNRLMRGLMHHNILYCSCNSAFSLGVILATIFFPFPVVHMIAEFVYSHFGGDGYLFAAGRRSLLCLSWSRECTGTSGNRIVFFVATMEWIFLCQRSW